MDSFRIAGAWSLGFRFVAQHWYWHAMILLGLGIALPLGLHYALMGGPLETVNLGHPGPDPYGNSWLSDRPLVWAVLLGGYVLQIGSYFASWRLGFGGSPGGALLYGLIAGAAMLLVVAVARTLGEYASRLVATPDTWFLAVTFFLAPLIPVMTALFVAQAVMVAGVVLLMLSVAMIVGAATGALGTAATLVGGDGSIAVLLLVLSGVSFWLAARLSCVAPLLASGRSLNLVAAVRESWRMTLEDQAAITRYLFLVGAAMALAVIGAAVATGAWYSAIPRGGVGFTYDTATMLHRTGLAVPFAFLTVMIPAGIYRLLTVDEISAEVFD